MLKIFLTAIGVTVAFALVVGLFRSVANTVSPAETTERAQQGEAELTLENTNWLATKLKTADVSGAGITAIFQTGSLSGSDGCNRYITSYTVNGSSLTIKTPIAGTMMACPATSMAFATKYVSALGQVSSYSIENNNLLLKDAEGTIVISYREDSQTLFGTNWSVTGLNNGQGAVSSVLAESSITLNFIDETQLGGSAGCNTYSGQYTAQDSTIVVGKIASTLMACLDEEVSAQETQYLAALQNATTYVIENDSLVMRDDDGAMQVTASRL